MIKSREQMEIRPIEIELSGPQGNAFYLIELAKKLSKQLGLDSEQVLKEMQASDYESLINVFDAYFGDYVTLYW